LPKGIYFWREISSRRMEGKRDCQSESDEVPITVVYVARYTTK